MSLLQKIPLILTLTRALLGPWVLWVAYGSRSTDAFTACLVICLISDYFDGVIARRLGVVTPSLRRMDSAADSIFYICTLIAAWHLHAEELRQYLVPLGFLIFLEIARYVYDLRKFGKEASYHMWSSKLWGLALFLGFYSLLVQGNSGWPVALAIYTGVIADIEGLVISKILPRWQTDVPTFVHALRQSQENA
jgi:phosphatidylglycerophosphate synthase